MKKLLFAMAYLIVAIGVLNASITIGTGTYTVNYVPTYYYYEYNYSQIICLRSEINGSGQITGIKINCTATASSYTTWLTKNAAWTIYLGTTTKTSFTSTTDWVPYSNLTQVYSGNLTAANFSVTSGAGWLTINFDTPFSYNNINNLVVAVDENTPGYGGTLSWYHSGVNNRSIYYYSDTNNPNPSAPPTAKGRTVIPNIQLLGISQNTPPTAPSNPTPANLTTGVTAKPTFSWASNGDTFKVFYKELSADTYTQIASGLTNPTYTFTTPLAYSATYNWYIEAGNSYSTTNGPIWTFTTMPDPTISSFPYSEGFDGTVFPPQRWTIPNTNSIWTRVTSGTYNGTAGAAKASYNHSATVHAILMMPPVNIIPNLNLYFYWRDNDSKIVGHDTTFCEISTDDGNSWTQLAYLSATGAQTNYTKMTINLNPYVGNGRLIRFRDKTDAYQAAYGIILDVVSIEEATNPPGSPTLLLPANLATYIIPDYSLIWNAGEGFSNGFYLYLGTNNPPTNIFNGTDISNVTTYAPIGLRFNTTYYWTVEAYNAYGISSGNTIRSFTTTSGVAYTSIPLTGSTNVDPFNRTLDWSDVNGANSYYISVGTSSGGNDLLNRLATTASNYTFQTTWPFSTKIYWTVTSVRGSQEVIGTEWNFTTCSNPTLFPPCTQNFNDTTFPPLNWSRYSGILSSPSSLTAVDTGWCRNLFGGTGTDYGTKVNVIGTNCKYWLISPPIDLGANDYNLEFDLALTIYNSSAPPTLIGSYHKFAVVISTDAGVTWTVANTLRLWDNTTSQYVFHNIATAGEHVAIDLSAYSGIVKIGFYGFSDVANCSVDLHIDNFLVTSVATPPSACTIFSPENNATGISLYPTITGSFNTGIASGYKIYFDTLNPPSTLLTNQVNSSYTFTTALRYGTEYFWQIIPYNEFGDADSCPVSKFTTMVDPTISSFPYIQDFQACSTTTFPAGWAVINENGDNEIWRINFSNVNKMAAIHFNASTPMNDWFFTPQVQLNAGTQYRIAFNYKAGSDLYHEKIELRAGNFPDASSMNETILFSDYNCTSVTFLTGTATITPTSSGTYYFGFHGCTDINGYIINVDNIRITYPGSDLVTAVATTSSRRANPRPESLFNASGMPINTDINIFEINGSPTITATIELAPVHITIPNVSLLITLSGTNFSGTSIYIAHGLGFIPLEIAYRILPELNWTIVTNPGFWTTTVIFTIPSNKSAGDIEIVLPNSETATLPITLSYFNANFINTESGFVQLNWRSESETDNQGYYLYRATEPTKTNAIKITPNMIVDGITEGTATSYSQKDAEIESNTTYYYWLENINIDNTSSFYGPVTVKIGDNIITPAEGATLLYNAYPNPFNPNTYINFSLKETCNLNIDIYNIKGEKVRTLIKGITNAGKNQRILWNGTNNNGKTVGSGIYFCKMTTSNYNSIRKMILLK